MFANQEKVKSIRKLTESFDEESGEYPLIQVIKVYRILINIKIYSSFDSLPIKKLFLCRQPHMECCQGPH